MNYALLVSVLERRRTGVRCAAAFVLLGRYIGGADAPPMYRPK
ncbi:hypothetical protein [Dictyobacter aurantiacus]|nr:hypothetical protein [Dictyobacter aurantiacus]